MADEETSVWVMAVPAVVTYAGYAVVMPRRAAGAGQLTEVAYTEPMPVAIGAAIAASIGLRMPSGGALGPRTNATGTSAGSASAPERRCWSSLRRRRWG